MPIIRWTPMPEPFEEFDKMLEGFGMVQSKGFTPAIDVYQTKDHVIVETPLPGVSPQDVEISIENDILTIRGETKKESEVEEKNYYRKEIRSGSFYRSVALPARVVGEKARAQSIEGMLKITIPKAPDVHPKTVKVSISKKTIGKKK